MNKSVIIAGHTGSLGSTLYHKFLDRGWVVFGASRSTGYDFRNNDIVKNFCLQLQGHDVFINTTWGISQRLLFEAMYDLWRNKRKVIVNVSSRITQYNMARSMSYGADKAALDFLTNSAQMRDGQWPAVLRIRPGFFESKRLGERPEPKMKVEDVAETVMWMIDNVENFRVYDLIITK